MSSPSDSAQETDNTVLSIFLPIVAILLLLCAGGCYLSERKRRKRLKRGAVEDHTTISDTESVISVSSARNRPYLLPSSTSGQVNRGAFQSEYDVDSTYGEPPPYSGRSRRSSVSSFKASQGRRQTKDGMYSDQSEASPQRPVSRSQSMLDLRGSFDSAPLRRSNSSISLQNFNRHGDKFSSRSSLTDEGYSRSMDFPSPAQSEWSIRTAPQMQNYSFEYDVNRPSSVASLPVRSRRGNIKRSMSQPDLNNIARKTGTYPQGILKRKNLLPTQHTGHQDHSQYPRTTEFYKDREALKREQKLDQSESNKIQQKKEFPLNQGYKRYARDALDGYSNHFPNTPENIYNGSVYSSGSSQIGYVGSERPWGPQYSQNYVPYSHRSNYWEQQNRRQQFNPYSYRKMMY